jgi:CheY-like chemotaxis protein
LKAHLLIVDDNGTNRMVAETLVGLFGCTCESVADGVEAVEAARSRRFDAVLMDIKMPRMDGVQATTAIRGLSAPAREVPIIALTANADPEDARGYIAAGMACVVEKPIKAERLFHALSTTLAHAATTPAVADAVAAA